MHSTKSITITSQNNPLPILLYNTDHAAKNIVIFCHGFPGSNRLIKMHAPLNFLGYAVAEIFYQGDKGTQGKFSFVGTIQNIIDSTMELKRVYSNARFVVLGYSYGGFAIINILNNNPDLFQNVCLLNPLIDSNYLQYGSLMPEIMKEACKILNMHESQYYQNELQLMQKKHNPINIKIPPCTIIQSSNDEILSPSIAQKYCQSNKCKYIEINGGTHGVEGNEKEIIFGITGREV